MSSSRWLGHLPAHWQETRLGHVAAAWTSNVDKHALPDQPPVRLCNYTDVYKNDRITADMPFMTATASPDQIDRFRLHAGDTVITKDSETADDIGIPAYVDYEAADLVCGYHLAIVRPRRSLCHPRFLYWAMAAAPTLRQWSVLAAGVTRVGIRSTDLTKAVVPRPPLAEQRAIADHLDRETERVDVLVAKQERLVATLQERRVSLISQVIDAGHDLLPFRRHLSAVRQGWSPNCEPEAADGVENWGVLKTGCPNGGIFRPYENKRLPDADVPRPDIVVRRDEIVMSRSSSREWVGSAARVDGDYPRLMLSDLTYGLTLRPAADPRFIVYALGSRRSRALLESMAKGTSPSMQKLSQRDIRELPLWVPELDEQRRIVDHLDRQTAKIDLLIAKAQRFIQLVTERRAALVTAAVTGQIDVRTASTDSAA